MPSLLKRDQTSHTGRGLGRPVAGSGVTVVGEFGLWRSLDGLLVNGLGGTFNTHKDRLCGSSGLRRMGGNGRDRGSQKGERGESGEEHGIGGKDEGKGKCLEDSERIPRMGVLTSKVLRLYSRRCGTSNYKPLPLGSKTRPNRPRIHAKRAAICCHHGGVGFDIPGRCITRLAPDLHMH